MDEHQQEEGKMSLLMRSRNQFEQVTAVSAVTCDGRLPPPPPALLLATLVKSTVHRGDDDNPNLKNYPHGQVM